MRRGYQFRKMNNDIVREYQENKNGELFLEKLLAMDMKPKDMKDEMTWYLNIATAFNVLGKRNECIALFKQLEEVATEKDKEYIQNRSNLCKNNQKKTILIKCLIKLKKTGDSQIFCTISHVIFSVISRLIQSW